MKENSNHFLDGLFWGALLGGAAVFLIGTKKGKNVMKIITDEGLSGSSKIEEIIKSCQSLMEEKSEEKKEQKRLFKGLPKKHTS